MSALIAAGAYLLALFGLALLGWAGFAAASRASCRWIGHNYRPLDADFQACTACGRVARRRTL